MQAGLWVLAAMVAALSGLEPALPWCALGTAGMVVIRGVAALAGVPGADPWRLALAAGVTVPLTGMGGIVGLLAAQVAMGLLAWAVTAGVAGRSPLLQAHSRCAAWGGRGEVAAFLAYQVAAVAHAGGSPGYDCSTAVSRSGGDERGEGGVLGH